MVDYNDPNFIAANRYAWGYQDALVTLGEMDYKDSDAAKAFGIAYAEYVAEFKADIRWFKGCLEDSYRHFVVHGTCDDIKVVDGVAEHLLVNSIAPYGPHIVL